MKEVIAKLIAKEVKIVKKEDVEKLVEIPPSSEMGDFAVPCFFLASKLKKSPQQIAQELSKKIKSKEFERIEAKQAYLNFFVSKKTFIEKFLEIDEDFGREKRKGKVVIDFSAPNVGKPMHIGHIRSTILGDSILRIHDFLGYDVLGINYLGDTGLHIGKLIVAYELWLDKKALETNPVQELLRLYIKFCDKEKTEYKEDLEEEFQDNEWTNKSKEKLKLIELGDKNTHKIWRDITESSKKGFNKVYKMLNVNFHETTGQSLFSADGKKIVTEKLKKGLAKIEQDGAVYVDLDEFKLPKKYILRSNGTASYMTQDIGAAVSRFSKYKFDKMIYVTDYRQELHFKQLFAILKKFGFNFSEKLVHVGFGTVNFGGEILATRTGKVILLEDVLKKTIEKAQLEIRKRKTKGSAEDIGVGAIKYAILKNSPQQDVNFSWEQALNFEGDTGPYLQYSYARASSILRKAKNKSKKPSKLSISNLEKSETELIKKILEFPQIVQDSYTRLSPAIIANYSFSLAQSFNEFYHSCPVLKSESESFRLELVKKFRIIIASCLDLLGIEVLEEM